MIKYSANTQVSFFELLRAGLWEQGVRMSELLPLDFDALYQLAEEQSVVGLIAAGLEHVQDMKVAKKDVLPFMKQVISLEDRNGKMNLFIAGLTGRLQGNGIKAVLVKGQGVAQCYARPQWRAAGDVDLLLDAADYEKAKALLIPLAKSVDSEDKRIMHQRMTIDSWKVELHGQMPTQISERINVGVERVQKDIFERGGVRVWHNEDADVFLPDADNDAIIIFTHFLQHFVVGGVGLRQISDWCRLLWTFRTEVNKNLLEKRLHEMGIMSEWRAFAYYAVSYLGMPAEAMPFYTSSPSLACKSLRISRIILGAGNFGHNKDQSYRSKYPKLIVKTISFFRRLGEFVRLSFIFPWDAPRFFLSYVSRR